MKYIRTYEKNYLSKTEEQWNPDIYLDFCIANPRNNCPECIEIRWLNGQIEKLIYRLDDPDIFELDDIVSNDYYAGVEAEVTIFGKQYTITIHEVDDYSRSLYVGNFPVSLTGDYYDISDTLNEIIEYGGIEAYLAANKFNL